MSEILYLSIVEDIKAKILAGEYGPRARLPSEATMTRGYGVSRMTIRKSLALLASEGYIYSVPGKGSFVCEPEKNLYQFRFSKYEDFTQPVEEVRLLRMDVVKGEERIRGKLQAQPSGLLLKAVRQFLSGGRPLAVEYTHFEYVPHSPVVEERLRFANHLEGLERSAGFALERQLRFSGIAADETVAPLLGCRPGDNLTYLEETAYNSDNGAVYHYEETFALPQSLSLVATTYREDSGPHKL